jgi:hypothetical protein
LRLDGSITIQASYHIMNDWLVTKVKMRLFCVVLLFALCQIIGTMCTVPDLLLADDTAQMAAVMSHMSCPMNGTIMCPPSAVSSPERQSKPQSTTDLHQIVVLLSLVTAFTVSPYLESLSCGSASEFIPISIASSSILRI